MDNSEIEYTLVDAESGVPAYWVHQDDMETPFAAGSLADLINDIGDWCDCTSDYVLENLEGDVFTDVIGGGAKFRIVKRIVTTAGLNEDDAATIKHLREEAAKRQAEFLAKYPHMANINP